MAAPVASGGGTFSATGAIASGEDATDAMRIVLMIDKQSRVRCAFNRADVFRICKILEQLRSDKFFGVRFASFSLRSV
jgi:hypothetical protein